MIERSYLTMIFYLKSGEEVIVDNHSHLHETAKPYIATALGQINSNYREKIYEIIYFNEVIGFDYCVETNNKDEIVYAKRKKRNSYTRFVKNRKAKQCNSLIVILKKDIYSDSYFLLSCYIGSSYRIKNDNGTEFEKIIHKKLAKNFWDNHAIIWGSHDVQIHTIMSKDEYFRRKKNKTLDEYFVNSDNNIVGIMKSNEIVVIEDDSRIEEAAKDYIPEALKKINSRGGHEIDFTVNLERKIGLDYVVFTNKEDNNSIFYAKTIDDTGYSRFVENRKGILSSFITMKLRRDYFDPNRFHLIEAYIGKSRKAEPWKYIPLPEDQKEESIYFWSKRAYTTNSELRFIENTKRRDVPSSEEY